MIVKRTKILELFGSQVFIMKSMLKKRVHSNSVFPTLAALRVAEQHPRTVQFMKQQILVTGP